MLYLLYLAYQIFSRNSFTVSIIHTHISPHSRSNNTIQSLLTTSSFSIHPILVRITCIISILSLSYFSQSSSYYLLYCLILSHVTHLAHFATRLRPSVVPCIHIHTLCPSSEEKITTQASIISLYIWTNLDCSSVPSQSST